MQYLVLPWVKSENTFDFKNIVSIMTESLESVSTEYRLKKYLHEKKLIGSAREDDPLNSGSDDSEDSSKCETVTSFFQLPHVFEKFKLNTNHIIEDGELNHFINLGNQSYCTSALHTTIDDLTCVYYSFPTLLNEYNSRLKNVFTALVFESHISQEFGND